MDMSKLSDADLQAVSAGHLDKVSDEGLQYISTADGGMAQPLPSVGSMVKQDAVQGAKAVGKGLDYLGGGSRALLAKIAEVTTGKDLVKPGEVSSALDPTTTQRFPGMGELMERGGVPAGASLSDVIPGYAKKGSGHPFYQPEKGGLLDPTLRGFGGFLGDVATDPITWMSMGVSGAAKKAAQVAEKTAIAQPTLTTLQKVTAALGDAGNAAQNAVTAPARAFTSGVQKLPGGKLLTDLAQTPSNIVREGSEGIYNSAIPGIIQAGKRYGNPNVGETMLQAGITGNPVQIANRMQAASAEMKAMRDKVYQAVDATGDHANLQDAFDPLFQTLQEHIKDGRLTPDQAAKIMSDVSEAKLNQPPNVSTELMSQWKTDAGNALPGSTWDDLATRSPTIANEVKQAHQAGLRDEIVRAADKAIPGAGAEIAARNAPLGDLINTQVQRAARSAGNKFEKEPFFSPTDLVAPGLAAAGVGARGAGAGATIEATILAYLAQKAAKAAGSSAVRTNAGWLGDRLMSSPLIAPALDGGTARSMINGMNPWKPGDQNGQK